KKCTKYKFSHKLTHKRKCEKQSIYIDARHECEKDTMDNWDEEKMEEVMNKKYSEEEKKKQKQKSKECGNFTLMPLKTRNIAVWGYNLEGCDICKYYHALPLGFVLKKRYVKKKGQTSKQGTLEINGCEVFEFHAELLEEEEKQEETDYTYYIQKTDGDKADDSVRINDVDFSLAGNGERCDLEKGNEGEEQENGAIHTVS
ncbi:Zinc finger CCCH domain-containing protein 15, partial [Galemys pyrenaicus]